VVHQLLINVLLAGRQLFHQLLINVLLAGRQLFHQLLQLFGRQLLVNLLLTVWQPAAGQRPPCRLPAVPPSCFNCLAASCWSTSSLSAASCSPQLLLQLFDESGSFGFGETQINDIDLTPSAADKVRFFLVL
jgi:hypothetical protein